jgi:hypothetical protein
MCRDGECSEASRIGARDPSLALRMTSGGSVSNFCEVMYTKNSFLRNNGHLRWKKVVG